MTKREWAWASYDWANSAFPTVITTFVIAAYFTKGIAPDPVTGQAQWGWMQAFVGLSIGLLSPVLGAIADAGGRRRAMLATCVGLCALATASIWFARPDAAYTFLALACVALASIAFEVGTVFYNAMLPGVTTRERLPRLSGIGFAMGYAGGLACLAACLVLLVQPNPSLFGLDRGQAEHVRAAALLVAAWVVVFALPVLLLVPDPPPPHGYARPGWGVAAQRGLAEILGILRGLPKRPDMARFLVARLFYTDGLNTTFAFGAIYAAGVFGMGFEELLLFGIALNVTAGIGAFLGGWVDERFGAKRTVMGSLLLLMVVLVAILLAESKAAFWTLGLVIGMTFGPAQAASRTLMARMAPPAEAAAHFGLFALSGRVTGFLGPLLLAVATDATQSQRAGMAVVLGLLILGTALLATVRAPR
ncbi:MAG: MFS transporter [Acetobacteraceae bacterium]|nr:MFS transporter [Acetobacteraceae bacterium]